LHFDLLLIQGLKGTLHVYHFAYIVFNVVNSAECVGTGTGTNSKSRITIGVGTEFF